MKLRRQMALSEAAAGVADLEKLAASLDGLFKPQSGDSVTDMLHRSQWCIAEIGKDLHSAANGAVRDAILAKFIPIVQKLGGLAEVDALVGEMRREDPAETAEQRDDWVKTHENVHMAMQQMADVQTAPMGSQCASRFAKSRRGLFWIARRGQDAGCPDQLPDGY